MKLIKSHEGRTERTEHPEAYVGNAGVSERMATLARLNAIAGYSAPKTIYPEGTPLIDAGNANLARERAEVASLPTVTEFAGPFLAWEKERDPRDFRVDPATLRMSPDTGRLYRVIDGVKRGELAMTYTGLSQLISLQADRAGIPASHARNLAYLPIKIRAEAFNYTMTRGGSADASEDRIARTALDPYGQRYLRAFTSAKHTGQAGGYAALIAALQRLAPDAKIRATHTEDRMDLEVIFPMMAREIRVGDILWGTLGITISETKDVAASVWDALMRVLCVNLTRAYYGKGSEFTRKHVGRTFLRDLLGRMREGRERLQPFIEAFGDSYTDAFPATMPTRAEVVARTFKALDAPKALQADSVIQAWDLDGPRGAGNTRAGLINALTRASQPLGIEDAESVERIAGRIASEGWRALA